MKKTIICTLLGAFAGIVDVVPMILQKLTWDANIAAFSMWVIIGFLLSVVRINIPGLLKGILISFLVLAPSAILIGWQEPFSLIPIGIMTLLLGGVLGLLTGIILKENKEQQ